YAISHSSQSADPNFNHVAITNVLVTVADNDKKEVIVKGTGTGNVVLEGDPTVPASGITDTYTVKLGAPVPFGQMVTVTLGAADPRLVLDASSAGSRWNAAAPTLTLARTN